MWGGSKTILAAKASKSENCISHRGRLIGLIVLCAFSFAFPSNIFGAGTVLIGTQSIASTQDSDQSGQAEAFQFAATSSGTVSTLTIYLDSGSSSTSLFAGLYASSGSNPGALLGQGTSATLTSGAWNTVAITPVNVTAGTVYWISILGTGGTLKFRDTGANCVSQSSSQTNLTSLPATWSVGSRWFSCTLSAYGSSNSTSPILSISSAALSFSGTQGSSSNPAAATVNISNSGAGTLTFTTSSDSPWLTVNAATGTAPQALQISASVGNLTAAAYTGHVTVTSSGTQGSPATITVTFVVAAPAAVPVLSVSAAPLSFASTQGSTTNPPAATLAVSNSGGGSISFTATSDSSWLNVSPSTGNAPQNLQISVLPGTLIAGTYAGHITITAAGIQGSPATVTATLVVAPPDVAPVISAVSSSSITAGGAVVAWTTDKASTSQVNYGTTTAYGTSSPLDSTMVTSHSVTLSGLAAGTLYHYQVQSADAAGSLSGSSDSSFTTAGAVSTCPCSIWSPSAVPGTPSVNDNQAVELGVKFTSDVSGFITGIRFYKGSGNTGSHTGSLWTTSGTLLATATFTGETSTGWQQVNFSTPVAINASTTYVASYHTNSGFYAGDEQFFASAGVDQAPLHALSNSVSGGDGVYVYGSGGAYPNSTYQSTNYWVDVVFNTTQGPQNNPTFAISGTISPSASGTGSTVTLGGSAIAVATADSSGNYSFSGLSSGSYTVTPTKSGYTFTSASQNVTINGSSVTGINFTAVAQGSFTISGAVTPVSGSNRPTLTLSGGATGIVTASRSSGNYTFSGLANGTYTITPSNAGYTFSPASQTVTISGANLSAINFTSAAVSTSFSISGILSPASNGSTAILTLTGSGSGTTTANSSGSYTFTGLANGTYTLTPSKPGFTFSPSSQAVTLNGANLSSVNFTAAALTYSISGALSPSAGGGGATVTLSGAASASTAADVAGNYSFSGVASGAYAVTPSSTGYNFSPTSQSVTVSSGNVTGVNFTASAAAATYTLSGTITPATAGAGSVVTLSGAVSSSTTADASGNFSFTSLANGSYTVTPSSQTATFSPTSQAVTISGANVNAINFTATATANVIFFDDFLGTTLGSQWTAMNRAGDYSNNEEECYNPSQVGVSNGNLVITTVAQTSTCGDSDHSAGQFPFLSGMIQWGTFNFTYGTVEFRAKTAGGRGSWPAIWMLGANCQASNIISADNVGACNWPNSGSDEIDILEMSDNNYISVGHDMFVSSGGQACFQNASSDTSQNWHVYTMTWKAGSVTYAIDGQAAGCSHTSNVPTKPMFLIINNAISPNWTVVSSDYPQTMLVDYVKVTQP